MIKLGQPIPHPALALGETYGNRITIVGGRAAYPELKLPSQPFRTVVGDSDWALGLGHRPGHQLSDHAFTLRIQSVLGVPRRQRVHAWARCEWGAGRPS